MASGKVDLRKNFISGATLIRNLGTSYGGNIEIPEDGYYFVLMNNMDTSTYIKGYISVGGAIISTAFAISGQWCYDATPPIPLKKGTTVYVESHCSNSSGLYRCDFVN